MRKRAQGAIHGYFSLRRKSSLYIKWTLIVLCSCLYVGKAKAQYNKESSAYVDFFMGVDFNYQDLNFNGRIYDVLVNLTPGMKWHMGKGWQSAAQILVPVINQYGDRYKKVRMNMAVLSKETRFGSHLFLKASGGLFGSERYGLDLKSIYVVNDWLAVEAQAGWTGFCSMAVDWEASLPKRWTALGGANIYLNRWNTQFRLRGGRFVYEDYGIVMDAMRHFKHCSVGVYVQYSDKGKEDGGFKIVMMLPSYKRTRRKVNFRPASNFRHVYAIHADAYANKMYKTDPEENEREGWFDRGSLQWGSNRMSPDFIIKRKEGRMKNE